MSKNKLLKIVTDIKCNEIFKINQINKVKMIKDIFQTKSKIIMTKICNNFNNNDKEIYNKTLI